MAGEKGQEPEKTQNEKDMSGEGMSKEVLEAANNEKSPSASSSSSNWFSKLKPVLYVVFFPYIGFWNYVIEPLYKKLTIRAGPKVEFNQESTSDVNTNNQNASTPSPTVVSQSNNQNASTPNPTVVSQSNNQNEVTENNNTLPRTKEPWSRSFPATCATEAQEQRPNINQPSSPIIAAA